MEGVPRDTARGIPVLVGADESTGPLAAVRALRAAGYAPWAAVFRPDTYVARSRAAAGVFPVVDPKHDPDSYAAQLADAARAIGAAAVLPATEGSVRALTGREGIFAEGTVVGAPSAELLERATDKNLLAELAMRAGLDTPPRVRLSRGDLEERAEELEFPVVVKPLRSVSPTDDGSMSTREVTRVDDLDQLRRLLAEDGDEPVFVEPYLRGRLAAICGVAWEGSLVCATHQVAHRTWPVECGNSSYAVTVPRDERLEAGAATLIGELRWSGVFSLQFLGVGERRYVIDFNPRVYGSLALAVAAGCNLPAIWTDLLLGRETRRPLDYRVGTRYRLEENDLRALAVAFRRGERLGALRGLIPRPRTTHAVFNLRDPAPTLATLGKARRRVGGLRARPQRSSAVPS